MKKLAFLSVLLLAVLVLGGCGKDEVKVAPTVGDQAAVENVKVKPASIELEERNDEIAEVVAPVVTAPATLEISLDEFNDSVSEVRKFEAKSDNEINSFQRTDVSRDREIEFLSAAIPEAGLALEEIKTAEEALTLYKAADDDELKIQLLQKAGHLLIGKRIWALGLNAAQLDVLDSYPSTVSELKNQKNNLEALRNSIAADNDLENLYKNVSFIVTDY